MIFFGFFSFMLELFMFNSPLKNSREKKNHFMLYRLQITRKTIQMYYFGLISFSISQNPGIGAEVGRLFTSAAYMFCSLQSQIGSREAVRLGCGCHGNRLLLLQCIQWQRLTQKMSLVPISDHRRGLHFYSCVKISQAQPLKQTQQCSPHFTATNFHPEMTKRCSLQNLEWALKTGI